eukprot:TRINITY_DN16737_c0_g1_i1.p1 TRINITY_DN16737_c0_g1~~TRINITY_DN16737_c0_g1_i1.p1  ORF type:complete len:213 (+),score=2.22 TRINITY_DN16737_c0_g1_i1:393-1031(+)
MAANLEFLRTLPISVTKEVAKCPHLLHLPIHTIQSKLDVIASHGVRTEPVLRSFPVAVTLSEQSLRSRFILLDSLGLDARRIVERFPSVLSRPEPSIRSHLNFLSGVGLDAIQIINAAPSIIGCGIEQNLRPTITFITKDMGRSLQDIHGHPASLSYSLEHRIKPRYLYMMLYSHRKDYALSTLLAPNNDRFSGAVARQSLQHYTNWLKSQF